MHSDLGRSDSGWMCGQLTEVGRRPGRLHDRPRHRGRQGHPRDPVGVRAAGRRERLRRASTTATGNVSFVLGGGVNGGTVYGTWPGLAADQLQAGDLKVTTDYRVVLGEILEKRCGLTGEHRAARAAHGPARDRQAGLLTAGPSDPDVRSSEGAGGRERAAAQRAPATQQLVAGLDASGASLRRSCPVETMRRTIDRGEAEPGEEPVGVAAGRRARSTRRARSRPARRWTARRRSGPWPPRAGGRRGRPRAARWPARPGG